MEYEDKENQRLKLEEKKRRIIAIHKFCQVCGKPLLAGNQNIELHHAFLHNTNGNRENYPNFIHSAFNLYPLHEWCHKQNPGWKPNELNDYIPHIIEQMLEDFKKTLEGD